MLAARVPWKRIAALLVRIMAAMAPHGPQLTWDFTMQTLRPFGRAIAGAARAGGHDCGGQQAVAADHRQWRRLRAP